LKKINHEKVRLFGVLFRHVLLPPTDGWEKELDEEPVFHFDGLLIFHERKTIQQQQQQKKNENKTSKLFLSPVQKIFKKLT
jgi:hypothetical protein